MFNYIVQKIQETLGSTFKAFNEFAPDIANNDEMLANYDIAVLHTESGSIRPLKGVQGLMADCSLDVLMKFGSSVDVDTTRFEKVLFDLANASNGYIEVQSETDATYFNTFNYIINYGAPTFSEINTINGINYAVMRLTLSVTLSADALFGNSGVVSVYNETKEEYEEIEGVIRWSQTIDTQMQTLGEVQETTVKNIPLFDIYSLSISGLLLKEASVTKSLINGFSLTTKPKYKVKVLIADDIYFEHYYYISKLVIVGVKSQFIEILIDFSEAVEWQTE